MTYQYCRWSTVRGKVYASAMRLVLRRDIARIAAEIFTKKKKTRRNRENKIK